MPNAAWQRLLRLVPAKEQDGLMLITANHTEIAIQAILRLDADFLVVKGRLAGSQDAGRVFFIPYEQIDHMGLYRAVKDVEFNEMFAGLDAPPPAAALMFPEPGAEANGNKTPMKSAVLERFRSRSATIITASPLAPKSDPANPTVAVNGQKTE